MTPSHGSGGFRSLAADLRERSDADLAALLLARPDLARRTIGDLASLAAAATTTASVTRALDGLDRPTLQVLEAALVLSPVDAGAVAQALGTSPDAVEPHLQALWTAALLWRSPEGLRPVRILAEVLPTPAGLAPITGEAPGALTPAQTARLKSLSEAESALLAALTWGPPVGEVTGRAPAATREARTALVAADLLEDLSTTRVRLPRTVALALREGRTHRTFDTAPPSPPQDVSAGPGVVDAAAAETSGLLALTDETLLTLEARPAAVLANGGIGVRDVTMLGRRLGIDAPAVHLLLTAAHAADLLAVGSMPGVEGHVWGPSPTADAWQQTPDAERAATLLRAWWTTPVDAAATGADKRLNALAEGTASPTARRLRQDLLTELVAVGGVPVTQEELVQRWAWSHPLRPVPGGAVVEQVLDQARLLGLAARGLRVRDRWVASPWLEALVREGAEAPVRDGQDAQALGADLETVLAEHLPEATSTMLVQADLTAVVPGRPTPALTRLLHLSADVESRGGATTHRFSERSLRRALDAGHPAAELREAISTASATGLPQPVDFLLREVAAGHGRVHVSDVRAVLVVDDAALATRMAHDPELSPLGLELVAPTVVTSRLSAGQARSFLREHGYGPSIGDDAPSTPRRVTPRGRPQHPVRSQRLTDEVAQERARALREASSPAQADGVGRAAPQTPPARQASDPVVVLAMLREAATDGAPVWIWHTDDLGDVRTVLLTPTSVEGGRLYGLKDGERLPRTWSVHRIVGASGV